MNTKRYLEQIGRIEKLIRNKQLEADKIRALCGLGGVQTDRERVQTSNISDPTGRSGAELASIMKQIEFWSAKRQKIISQIDKIEDTATYEILTYRYVQQMSVFEIADFFEITEKQVWRRINKAHKVFEGLYSDTYTTKSN